MWWDLPTSKTVADLLNFFSSRICALNTGLLYREIQKGCVRFKLNKGWLKASLVRSDLVLYDFRFSLMRSFEVEYGSFR